MKNLFFIAVAIGIFSGTSFTAKSQTSINLEKVGNKSKSKVSLKFIDNIEINPGKISGNSTEGILIEKNTSASVNIIRKNTTAGDIEKCSPIQFKYAMIMDREVETITNSSLYNLASIKIC